MRGLNTRIKHLGITFAAIAALAISFSSFLSPGAAPQSPAYLPTALSYPASAIQAATSGSPQSAFAAPVSTNSSNKVYYRQTGHYIQDAFLNYWLMNGGATIYGYPISEETTYNGVVMQYFERARFEYRANSIRPWHVELSPVGSMMSADRSFAPATQTASTPGRTYYEQTGHTLGGAFGDFWQGNGGLSIFGYPISEELSENGKVVQYFERARLELSQGHVQIGRVGSELLAKDLSTGLPASAASAVSRPGFEMSFRGNATVFNANWDRVISLNKGWGNLPQDYVGQGLYAAAPADLGLYGRWARVTRGHRSVFVQFIDVINWPDIPYVRSKGIVIDLGDETYHALGVTDGGRYEVSFDVFWPSDGPDQ